MAMCRNRHVAVLIQKIDDVSNKTDKEQAPPTVDENAGDTFLTKSDEHEDTMPGEEQATIAYRERVTRLKGRPAPLEPPMVQRTKSDRVPQWTMSPNAMSVAETDSNADRSSDTF
jgi:hypothetical protein